MTRSDIGNRADIDRLLVEFYKLAIHDAVIGHHFVDLDLEHNLPIIGDFWEKVLFNNPVYFNNPLAVHQRLHLLSPLMPQHFVRWVELFSGVVDRMFSGNTADLAKSRAKTIANSLDQRLNPLEIAR